MQGETWTLLGEAPDWQKLYDRREDYRIGVVPRGGLFLTAGADVQKDRIEVEIAAWGRGKESWSVDYRVFEGDTSRPAVWEKLTGLLNETFTTASGLELPILQLAVDSGFATTEVYQWARRQGGRVLVIKGDSRTPALLGAASPVDVGPLGARIKRGIRVWPVNSSMAKEELYRWLRLERPTDEDIEKGNTIPTWLLPLSEVRRRVLQADHRRATGHEARQGLPAARMAEDARAQRGSRLPGVRARCGQPDRHRALPGEALGRLRAPCGRASGSGWREAGPRQRAQAPRSQVRFKVEI